MEKNVQQKLDLLKRQVRTSEAKAKVGSRRGRSSLHQIIKTKEQADRFMRLLQSA